MGMGGAALAIIMNLSKNKYKNKPIKIDGIRFSSIKEGKRYLDLKLLLKTGKIALLSLQPVYTIKINGNKICKVILDFVYYDEEKRIWVYEDVKGLDTPLSKLKRKMVEASEDIVVTMI